MARPRYPYEDGHFVDDEWRRWRRHRDWLEPDEVDELLSSGVSFLVEWCRPPRPEPVSDDELRGEVLPLLMVRTRARKKMRKRNVPTVFVAELWVDGPDRLLIFHEGAPAPRASDWFD